MKLSLHEIRDEETVLEYTDQEAWLKAAIADNDEEPPRPISGSVFPAPKTAYPIHLKITLRRMEEMVLLEGDIKATVQLLCSRCAKSFASPIDTHFGTILSQDKELAGIAHLGFDEESDSIKRKGQNFGHSRGSKTSHTNEEYEVTYIKTDDVELGQVVSEQVRLQVPFQPLCKNDCKGMCAQCGADWNRGRCACAKILAQNPFSALKAVKTVQKTK